MRIVVYQKSLPDGSLASLSEFEEDRSNKMNMSMVTRAIHIFLDLFTCH